MLYAEKSWNPLAAAVQLTNWTLRIGLRQTPLTELNLVAMADAYQRGQWLGGGGALRPLHALPADSGIVPITRFTGSAKPLKVKEARAFADALGRLAVQHSGGPAAVAQQAALAAQHQVPLWLARRTAVSPSGPVTVTVDRRLVRADVWAQGLPAVRLRGPRGLLANRQDPTADIRVFVESDPTGSPTGSRPAEQALLSTTESWRKSRRSLTVHTHGTGVWTLTRHNARSSWLSHNGQQVALLTRPTPAAGHRAAELQPLTEVRYETHSPMAPVMAHFFGVSFGIGDLTGKVRFGSRRPDSDGGDGGPDGAGDASWSRPWFTSLGGGRDDSDGGDNHDGGTGSDGGGSDSGDGGSDGGGGD